MAINMFGNNYICALDLSSSKIAAVAVKLKKNKITELYSEMLPSRGIKRGGVVDSIELVASVGQALKNLRAKSGINIKYVYANISGEDITFKHSKAIIPLADRGNKVITLSDIEKVNEQARILGSNLEEEIIDQVPFSYSIDSKNNISSPFGLYSHKLEADLFLVSAKQSTVQTLTRVINQAGFEIKDLFFPGFAVSRIVFNEKMKAGVNIVCDIGNDITEILIFEDGLLKNARILTLGGGDLTDYLSKVLEIPAELAEDVLRSHASILDPEHIGEDKEILIKKESLYKPIKQKMILEAVYTKAKSLCQEINKNIAPFARAGDVNNFVVCGRNVLLEGFLEMLEGELSIPVKLGRIMNPEIARLVSSSEAMSGQKYLTYLVCLGMVLEAKDEEIPPFSSLVDPNLGPVAKIIGKVKEVYQEYF